ncbi:putative membrane protein [Microbacterium hydrothermale]|nr:putative membrane protein [Microbacterium hydrothermale]
MSSALRSAVPFSLSTSHLSGLTRRMRTLPSLHVGAAALIVLVSGLLLSIATTSDPLWWQLHFSQLGIFGDLSSAFFNTTLKVSGLIVVVFAFCVRRDVRRVGRGPVRRGAATVAFLCLNVVGVNLALVGCIPLNTDKDLHDRVAGSMVLGFLALLISAPIMFNRLGKRMAVSTAVATVWLLISITLFVTATINLALFETISCTAMFAWSGMFTHVLAARAARVAAPARTEGERTTAHLARRRAGRSVFAASFAAPSFATASFAAAASHPSALPLIAVVSHRRSPLATGPGRATGTHIDVLSALTGTATGFPVGWPQRLAPLSATAAVRRAARVAEMTAATGTASSPAHSGAADAAARSGAAQATPVLTRAARPTAAAPSTHATATTHGACADAHTPGARRSTPRPAILAADPQRVSASRAAHAGSAGARRPRSAQRPSTPTRPCPARHAGPGAVRSLLR